MRDTRGSPFYTAVSKPGLTAAAPAASAGSGAAAAAVAKPSYIGGAPSGNTGAGTYGMFGLNTNQPPTQSGAGYLGRTQPQAPNPWVNNLLPGGGIPVSQQNPAYNLFTNNQNSFVTPSSGAAAPPVHQQTPGPAIRPTAPQPMPSGVPTQPPGNATPGAAPTGLPSGMPPMTGGGYGGGWGGPPGGMPGVGFGVTPRPSPLLAASNPASGQPQAFSASGAQQMTPQQIQQLIQQSAPGGMGSGMSFFADGGSATSDPDIPYASGSTPSDRIAGILQSLQHSPPARSAAQNQPDPMAMIMSPYGSGGGGGAGGDNSVQSIMQRLRLQPGVVRVGAPAYAGGGSPLAAASAGLATGPGHVMGPSGGQDDNVNARLSDGEYIMDADTVSNLGDGNNAAGAAKLDAMRQNIRAHKRSAPPSKIPPKAKKPEAYLKKSAASAAAGAAMGRRGR